MKISAIINEKFLERLEMFMNTVVVINTAVHILILQC